LGATATAAPAVAVWLLPALIAICVAAPTIAVAVNVSGLPASPGLVAVSVLAPTAGPRVQLPTVAIPLALVVAARPVAEPPPEATAKVTLTPLTGLLLMSLMSTLGAIATAVPDVAVWLLPAFTVMVPAPTPPVAENVSGLPMSPALVAVRVLAPTAGPRVQLSTVAIPLALVVAGRVPEPPPEATANVTLTPLTGLLLRSRTNALGATATAEPAIAV